MKEDACDANVPISGIGSDVRAKAVGELKDFPGRALFVPTAAENLLSLPQLMAYGWAASFMDDTVTLTAKNRRKIVGMRDNDNLFTIDESCYIAVSSEERGAVGKMLWNVALGILMAIP